MITGNSPRILISRRVAASTIAIASRVGIAHVLGSAFLTRLCGGDGREDCKGDGGEEYHGGRNGGGSAGGCGEEKDIDDLGFERGI